MPNLPCPTTPYYGGKQVSNPADVQIITGAPNAADVHHSLGDLQVRPSTGQVYCLTNTAGGTATWAALGGGSANVNTIQGDAGGALSPVGGNMILAGTAAQGISTSGAGHTITLTIADWTTAQKGVGTLASNAEAIAGAVATKAIVPTSLKAKLGTQTDHGVLVGAGTAAAITALAVGTNGQLLCGSTAADPAFTTLTTSTGIAFTTGAHTLAINNKTAGFAWTSVAGAAQAITAQNGYIATNAAQLVATLPATAAIGDTFIIATATTAIAGWKIAQNALQYITQVASSSTPGVLGFATGAANTTVTISCIETNIGFTVVSASGTVTFA